MSTTIQPERVVAAVVRRDQTWLVCKRTAEKRHGGLWEFPGGKVEPGEDDATALSRELAEELGVKVSRVGKLLLSIHDPGSTFLVVFTEVEIEGNPYPLEHSALRWVSLEAIRQLPLAPTDRRFVATLGADDKQLGAC